MLSKRESERLEQLYISFINDHEYEYQPNDWEDWLNLVKAIRLEGETTRDKVYNIIKTWEITEKSDKDF